ncbi:MAG: ATP-binding protein [Acidimicrobiia bacterium]|nr:ATP-binding protein [Acidimicrobiia bacterium]
MGIWEPTPDDLARVFVDQNPWGHLGSVPAALAPPVERPLARVLWRRLLDNQPRRYHVILGPRRVGKTTVLYQTVQHLITRGIDPRRVFWLRMDHPCLMQVDMGDLVRLVIRISGATPEQPAYLMLDELVYAEKWDLWLKTFYDEQWPVRIAATSSATAALRDRRIESGVGRWEEQYLLPYSFGEFLELMHDVVAVDATEAAGSTLGETLRSLPEALHSSVSLESSRRMFMLIGGFPELLIQSYNELSRAEAVGDDSGGGPAVRPQPLVNPTGGSEAAQTLVNQVLTSQQILRSDAVERAIYKDIPQSFGVDDPLRLERLLYLLAGQITGLLSPSKICSALDLSQPTFDKYLSYFEQTFLVFRLPNYSGSETNVQRRGRKLYFVDGAVRNAALQRGLRPFDDPVEQGLLIENLAATSLKALAQQSGLRLFHWRDGKYEVDLVLDDPNDPLAFEIASSMDHRRTGLLEFAERHRRFRGRCYLVAPQAPTRHPNQTGTDVGTLPLDMFLLTAGVQAQRALDLPFGRAEVMRSEPSDGLDL